MKKGIPTKVSDAVKLRNPGIYGHDKLTPVAFTTQRTMDKHAEKLKAANKISPAGSGSVRHFVIPVDPVPAPRMTRSDKWRGIGKSKPRRPCVQRYFDYRDAIRLAVGDMPVAPDELHCRFYVAMPESWSAKRRSEMNGRPHRVRPDRDNFDKAVSDALFIEDGGVWKGSQEKLWALVGSVELRMVWR